MDKNKGIVETYKQKVKFEESKNEQIASEFNLLTFFLTSIAILGMLGIYLIYYQDISEENRTWSRYALMMFIFGLSGIVAINYFNNKRFEILANYYKPLNADNVFFAFMTWAVLLGIQIIMGVIEAHLAPADIVQIAYTIFAAVCEELFYRGLILGFFIWLAKGKNKGIMLFGVLITAGLMVSSLAFAASHTNYYDRPLLLVSVFLSGLVLGFMYVWKKDIMIPILAHFLLNCTVMVQQFINGGFSF